MIKKETIQDENFEYYKKNAVIFSKKYKNKYLLIANKSFIKDFDNIAEAYKFGISEFGLGNFIIQLTNDYCDVHYLSRLSFS